MKVFLLSLLIFTCGCAALMELVDEGRQIIREKVARVAESLDVMLGDEILDEQPN